MVNDKKVANVKLKLVPIDLDKKRNLCYDMNAFSYLEDTFGSIQTALKSLQDGKIKSLLEVLKAGLIHEDETVTVKQIGSGFGITEMVTISALINEAMGRALPDLEEGKKGKNE